MYEPLDCRDDCQLLATFEDAFDYQPEERSMASSPLLVTNIIAMVLLPWS